MLSERELERYRRQILFLGEDGQESLKKAKVIVAGAGGLGCPVLLYLAAAGVGTIAVVDKDTVERTNLNRQILFSERDIGKEKAVAAGDVLRTINPNIVINTITAAINEKNVMQITEKADGIVDAMDNYTGRYLLNNAALRQKIPLFHGAIRGMFGQVTTIVPGKTPCLRCIFPHPPPEETQPAIGVTAGVIAMMQATEVIKYFTGNGRLLTGRLMIWDGLAAVTEELTVVRNQDCPACRGIYE